MTVIIYTDLRRIKERLARGGVSGREAGAARVVTESCWTLLVLFSLTGAPSSPRLPHRAHWLARGERPGPALGVISLRRLPYGKSDSMSWSSMSRISARRCVAGTWSGIDPEPGTGSQSSDEKDFCSSLLLDGAG